MWYDTCCVDGADMSVEEEDKPEQQLGKLAEVAEAAPIKPEPHGTHAASAPPAHQQPQQPDTVQVRVSEAGAAEVDPLHDGHPADLDTPAVPAAPAVPADSASGGPWGLARGDDRSVLAKTQPMHDADQVPLSSVAKMDYSHRHEDASFKAPGSLRGDVYSARMSQVGGLQVKDEDAGAVLGFQMRDADMANEEEEEDVDIGTYVKAEEAMSQQASGSSGSENGQAVLMDLDAQGRQPSPVSHAKASLLGQLDTRMGLAH